MEITLEQGLAAVVRYIQDHAEEGTKLYFDELPEDFICPLCKHGAVDFEPIQ